jgi:hypothetical protein
MSFRGDVDRKGVIIAELDSTVRNRNYGKSVISLRILGKFVRLGLGGNIPVILPG